MSPKRTRTHSPRIATALLAASLAFAPMTPAHATVADDLARQQEQLIAYEMEHGGSSGRDWEEAQWRSAGINLAPQADTEPLPEKFDLRDYGVVTPVKNQSPWGSCWAFGAIAASETSILSELGLTYNDLQLDLSERQLAYFSGTPLPNAETMTQEPAAAPFASQAGEGITPRATFSNPTQSPFNTGGTAFYATTLFASGAGPLLESEAPYRNDEGIAAIKADEKKKLYFLYNDTVSPEDQKAYDKFCAMDSKEAVENPTNEHTVGEGTRQEVVTDELVKSGALDYYAARPVFDENGIFLHAVNNNVWDYSWGLPFSKRFALSAELEESKGLTSPAATNADGTYVYDPQSTEAIKRELMAGRGVHIEFHADQSRPGETIAEDAYLNPNTWSHYSYDRTGYNQKVTLNHDVCIVGWDDTWAVENFNKGTYKNPETGMTVNRFPPAPGAWIVKNSWGAKGVGFPNEDEWGIDGSGYFYLSYYDMSLTRPNTYNYYTDNLYSDHSMVFINQYDFLSCYDAQTILTPSETSVANVFEAEDDQLVRTLSVETSNPDTHVALSLYRLDNPATETTDETQLASAANVVTDPTAGELLETVEADYPYGGYHRLDLSKSHYMARGQRFSVVATLTVETSAGTQYVTPARSWFTEEATGTEGLQNLAVVGTGVVNEGESFLHEEGAWTDWLTVVTALEKQSGGIKEYDNFPLKAFSDDNVPFVLTKEVVDEKEVYYPGDEVHYRISVKNGGTRSLVGVVIEDSLVELGEKGKIENVPAGEEQSIEYSYQVTEADAQRGSVANTAKATLESVEGVEATVDVSVKCAAAPAPTPTPQPKPTPAPDQPAPAPAKSLPKTGDEPLAPLSLAVAATAFGALAIARKLRRQ